MGTKRMWQVSASFQQKLLPDQPQALVNTDPLKCLQASVNTMEILHAIAALKLILADRTNCL